MSGRDSELIARENWRWRAGRGCPARFAFEARVASGLANRIRGDERRHPPLFCQMRTQLRSSFALWPHPLRVRDVLCRLERRLPDQTLGRSEKHAMTRDVALAIRGTASGRPGEARLQLRQPAPRARVAAVSKRPTASFHPCARFCKVAFRNRLLSSVGGRTFKLPFRHRR